MNRTPRNRGNTLARMTAIPNRRSPMRPKAVPLRGKIPKPDSTNAALMTWGGFRSQQRQNRDEVANHCYEQTVAQPNEQDPDESQPASASSCLSQAEPWQTRQNQRQGDKE